jgi:alpha-ribazole phosphatase
MWPTLIDLMRHGEPEGGSRYRGHIDHPLTQNGWEQMRAQIGDTLPWQEIITSPLLRCAEFAEELARETGLPLAYEPRLMEIHFGDWEGKTAAELEKQDKQAFYAFYDDPLTNTPPGAESLTAFQNRVCSAWQDIQHQYQQRHVLVVTHGGSIRIILAQVLKMPLEAIFRLDVPYAAISRIQLLGKGAQQQAQLKFHAGKL